VPIDVVTFAEALDAIEEMIVSKRGGSVFTPNIDHVVIAEEDPRFRRAYEDVSLSVVDGTPLLWASHLLGTPLPEKISGSDLMLPAIERAAARGFRVYLLGGADGVAKVAADKLHERFPTLEIAGYDSPRINVDESPDVRQKLVDQIKATKPDMIFVCLGAPKQELWIDSAREALKPAVLLGVGAGIDFVAGTAKRAPEWISKAGLEWLYRLSREPKRLWRRYLIRDPKFLVILARALLQRDASKSSANAR
jgi:N-acetylglucosaminyldiphosphoundecaprenol N-acetyl-beta-D-mannosaminyltransferase